MSGAPVGDTAIGARRIVLRREMYDTYVGYLNTLRYWDATNGLWGISR
jgi:hypothetical protein